MTRKIRNILPGLLLIAAGCGNNSTAPQVLSTTPANGASSVALNTSVKATFSDEMDSTTLTTSTFTVGTAAGSVELDTTKKIATFTPNPNLTASTSYKATVTTGAKNTGGEALDDSYSWSFSTGSSAAPAVSSTTPASAATGVALNATIQITFSNEMDTTTINTTTITVSGVTGTVSLDASKKTATFTPSTVLAANTTFNATVTTGAKDTGGNPLANNYAWSFTTGS